MKQYLHYLHNRLKLFVVGLCVLVICLTILLCVVSMRILWLRVILGFLVAGETIMGYMVYVLLHKPYLANEKIKYLFAQGAVYNDLFAISYPSSEVDESVYKRFSEMIDTQQLISASKKEAEYLALQNQINPHFLYNTLEGIRSEALIAGVDSIAEMTEALATFFRYTISQTGNLVTLEDELENIENYYYIQQFRFGDKLELAIEYDSDEEFDEEDILNLKLPKLTLQPLVENAIYHGVETKIGKGHLKIRIKVTKNHLIVKISDDGMGISNDKLLELNDRLKSHTINDAASPSSKKGGIAIQNVSNRIKLLFGEDYGIYLYSWQGTGTDVEITLPIVHSQNDSSTIWRT